jgi:hypothetical protein
MMVYTAHNGGERAEKMKDLGLGVMLHSCPSKQPRPHAKDFPCALDNGAFSCWQRGFPFQADVFREAIALAYRGGISLDFIVCPDLVARGRKSLDFSMEWAMGELKSAPRLALAVQDGMTTQDVSDRCAHHHFSHIFVGGTREWKWNTAQEWIEWAHAHGMKAHIGRCGSLRNLQAAERMGADSVDATNFARFEEWHIIEEWRNPSQGELMGISNNVTCVKHETENAPQTSERNSDEREND